MHYINRKFMPQIDEAQITPLLAHLAKIGVNSSFHAKPPNFLVSHQEVDIKKVEGIMGNQSALDKPLLVAQHGCVLDGNHRAAAHKAINSPVVTMIIIPLPYEDALLGLAEARESYAYGDGDFHPITQ